MESNTCIYPSPAPEAWRECLATFAEVPPQLASSRRLDRRCDTKFLLHPSDALDVVSGLSAHYAAFTSGTERLATYRTVYFDTPSFASYHAHRRGRRLRHKVRIRHYLDRQLSMFEVKSRSSEQVTSKYARELPFLGEQLDVGATSFVAAHTDLDGPVIAHVQTHFRRITLVHLAANERLTVDLDFSAESQGLCVSFPGIAIVEVKQWPFSRATPTMRVLSRSGVRRSGAVSVSKYCMAVAFTRPSLPHNRFLPVMRALARGAR